MKRPMFAAALVALAGAAVSVYGTFFHAVLIVMVFLAGFAAAHKLCGLPDKYFLILAVFPVIYFATQQETGKLSLENCIKDDGSYVGGLNAKVVSVKAKDNYTMLVADGCDIFLDGIGLRDVSLVIYTDVTDVKAGDAIEFSGKIKKLSEPTNYGQFNSREYYISEGISYSFTADKLKVTSRQTGGAQEFLQNINTKFTAVYDEVFDEENAGLVSAMVLGDKTGLDSDVKDMYSRNGIAHLLCVSGLHVSITGMLVYRMLRRFMRFIPAGIFGIVIVSLYLSLTGNSISATRAVIMIIINMLSDMAGRTYDSLSALSLAAVLMIFENGYVIKNTGFLLSFLAIVGIIFIQPIFCTEEKLFFVFSRKDMNKFKRYILEALAVSLSVQLSTLPVVLLAYYQIPLYGIVLNLIVIPLMSYIMISGILAGIAGIFCMSAAYLFAGPAEYILDLYAFLCGLCEKIPGGILVTGHPDFTMTAIYTCILILWASVYFLKDSMAVKKFIMPAAGKINVLFAAGVLFAAAGMNYKYDGRLCITMLDVGQGDGILMVTPSGDVYLFDGGSTDVKNVGKYRIYQSIKYFGLKRIDYLTVSHTDKDHYSGVLELMELTDNSFSIGTLYMADIAGKEQSEAYMELVNKAEEKNIKVEYVSSGNDIAADGTKKGGEYSVECIHPRKNYSYSSANDSSAVYMIKYGDFSMLMMGDAEAKAEADILANINLSRITVLKTGHHGSKGASSEAFLDKTSPLAALISCGKDNSYGHPHAETIKRLKKHDTKIYTTPTSGAITIKTDGKTIGIEEYTNS